MPVKMVTKLSLVQLGEAHVKKMKLYGIWFPIIASPYLPVAINLVISFVLSQHHLALV